MSDITVQTEEEILAENEEGEDVQPVAKLIAISGLWLNTDKDGNPYFTGYMGNARIWIFKNKFKTDDKHPDYTLSIGENRKQSEADKKNVKF